MNDSVNSIPGAVIELRRVKPRTVEIKDADGKVLHSLTIRKVRAERFDALLSEFAEHLGPLAAALMYASGNLADTVAALIPAFAKIPGLVVSFINSSTDTPLSTEEYGSLEYDERLGLLGVALEVNIVDGGALRDFLQRVKRAGDTAFPATPTNTKHGNANETAS